MTLFVYWAAFSLMVGGAAGAALVSRWFVLAVVAGLLVTGYAARRTLGRRS